MHSRFKWSALTAWLLCAAACLAPFISIGDLLVHHAQSENIVKLVGDMAWNFLSVPFAITAALIVSRQAGNVIGWLLMVPALLSTLGLPFDSYLSSMVTPPANPGFLLQLLLWFSNWDWLALIFPILLIALLFPDGRPPSARWRWVLILAFVLCTLFILLATFAKKLGPLNADWTVANPIGFLDESFIPSFIIFWGAGLMVMTISSAASLFVRYRRSGSVEREQIKWLLYACSIFAVIYIPGIWINNLSSGDNSIAASFYNILFGLSIFTFPAAIAIAILRYHLWDIDLIIRRTLVYGGLTATLGLIYFGSVILLQQVLGGLTGQTSIAIVLSTLLIAGLFDPIRRWVQGFIDRRFYRPKYDAARALEEFSAAARREVELDRLTGRLADLVEQTVQPDGVWIWMRDKKRQENESK